MMTTPLVASAQFYKNVSRTTGRIWPIKLRGIQQESFMSGFCSEIMKDGFAAGIWDLDESRILDAQES
jgi:hypothetical protein